MEFTYAEEKLGNGNVIKYKISPMGTAYHKDTPDRLVNILENLRLSDTRIRIYFGDRDTGRDWEEQYDVFGTIGRSTGRIKIPLLISSSRSLGGGALLDDAIVKIEYANKNQGGVIWQHPGYHREETQYPASRSYHRPSSKPRKTAKKQPLSGFGGIR
jgi:hypothetical protein